jgi:hypothetical protein
MVKHENIVTVIQAVLWIGAVSFLIWYSVEELQKVKDTDYLPPSVVDAATLPFPGLIICQSVEALAGFNATLTSTMGINMAGPAQVKPLVPWEPLVDGLDTYFVCPRVVRFKSPNDPLYPSQRTAQCVDFTQKPVRNDSMLLSCDPEATTSQWRPSDITKPSKVDPWVANSANAIIQMSLMADLENGMPTGESPKPMVAMLYGETPMFGETGWF